MSRRAFRQPAVRFPERRRQRAARDVRRPDSGGRRDHGIGEKRAKDVVIDDANAAVGHALNLPAIVNVHGFYLIAEVTVNPANERVQQLPLIVGLTAALHLYRYDLAFGPL